MLKKVAIFAPLLGLVVFAAGCCCVQPCASMPCGDTCCDSGCDTCGDMCDESCGDCGCDTSCQPCGTCCTPCCTMCCVPNPLHCIGGLIGGLVQKACCCDSGCGERYWGGWHNYPPMCDPCDPCGEWIGDGGVGCYEACGGYCASCRGNNVIPQDAEIISRSEMQQINPAPKRAPTKAAPKPKPIKKSPQARRPYYNLPRR